LRLDHTLRLEFNLHYELLLRNGDQLYGSRIQTIGIGQLSLGGNCARRGKATNGAQSRL